MTRFAIDSATALRLVSDGRAIAEGHSLVAPSALRSHALSTLYRAAQAGTLDEQTARARLEGIAGLKIRLLGDRVSRATAWRLAAALGLADTTLAEYLAVAVLQADAMVTDDPELVALAQGQVPVVSYEQFLAHP